MAKIDLKEVMRIIRSGEWFSVRLITADVLKGKGGQILEFSKARIARKKLMEKDNTLQLSKTGFEKEANHNFHFTVNLELPNKQIRKVHPILITQINNLQVI